MDTIHLVSSLVVIALTVTLLLFHPVTCYSTAPLRGASQTTHQAAIAACQALKKEEARD